MSSLNTIYLEPILHPRVISGLPNDQVVSGCLSLVDLWSGVKQQRIRPVKCSKVSCPEEAEAAFTLIHHSVDRLHSRP